MLEIIYHFNLILDQWRHCCSVSWNLGPRNVAVTICGQYAVSRRRPDIAPAFWTDDLLNYFNSRIVAAKMLAGHCTGQCQTQTRDCCYADTECVTCRVPPLGHVWHVGWVTSEEYHDVILIRTQEDDSSLKRIWQQSAWVEFISGIRNSQEEWRRRGVLSTQHSNTSRQFAEYH